MDWKNMWENSRSTIISGIIAVVVIAGLFFLFNSVPANQSGDDSDEQTSEEQTDNQEEQVQQAKKKAETARKKANDAKAKVEDARKKVGEVQKKAAEAAENLNEAKNNLSAAAGSAADKIDALEDEVDEAQENVNEVAQDVKEAGTQLAEEVENSQKEEAAAAAADQEAKQAALPTKYTVVKGDSLWEISTTYYGTGYSWVVIAQENKLANPDVIHAGNVLTVPKPEVKMTAADSGSLSTPTSYTVVAGDTLWGISLKYYGSGTQWTKIKDANPGKIGTLSNGNPLITPGQVLVIP